MAIWKSDSCHGWNFSLTENMIVEALKSEKNKDGRLRIYYQVDLLYLGDDKVPRALLQQAVSNNSNVFGDLIRLIPNIDLSRNINYTEWEHMDNREA